MSLFLNIDYVSSLVILPGQLDLSVALPVLSLDLEVPVLTDLVLHAARLHANELDAGQDEDVIIEHHAGDQDTKTNELEEEEVLPANGHAHRPDYEGPHRVQHHPGSGRQFFGHRDTGEVKECN